MRLTELEPRWGIDADLVIGGVSRHYEGRHGMAVTFQCPHCRTPRPKGRGFRAGDSR
jgi:hypothetical protein